MDTSNLRKLLQNWVDVADDAHLFLFVIHGRHHSETYFARFVFLLGFAIVFGLPIVRAQSPSVQPDRPAEADAARVISQIAQSQSQGVVSITSFSKTDGQSRQVEGVAAYVMYFHAVAAFSRDCRWSIMPQLDSALSFNVVLPTTARGDPWGNFLYQSTNPGIAVKGGSAFAIDGTAQFERTEQSWKLVQLSETSMKPTTISGDGSNPPNAVAAPGLPPPPVDESQEAAAQVPIPEEGDPGYTDAFFRGKAQDLLSSQQFSLALRYANIAMTRPGLPTPLRGADYRVRGMIKLALKDYAGARDDFQQSLQAKDAQVTTHYWLGASLQCLRSNDEALAEYRQVISHNANGNACALAWVLGAALGKDLSTECIPMMESSKDAFFKDMGLFLDGKMTEADLLAAAGNGGPLNSKLLIAMQLGMTYYLAAMRDIGKPPHQPDLKSLQSAISSGSPLTPSYALAQFQLDTKEGSQSAASTNSP